MIGSKWLLLCVLPAAACGCGDPMSTPRVIFLDGAGWYTGDGPVRDGLRRAGFSGTVERFNWQGVLGALPDHILAGRAHPRTAALARRVTELRRANPQGRIVLMALSAGTSLVVAALEKLPEGVEVDHVVLLSPSITSRHDLTEALRHVRGRFYATHSPHDALLASAGSAGLEAGRPAGQVGFVPPPDVSPQQRKLYAKLINLPWRPEYLVWDWNGGHVSVTRSEFIRAVIAPRILDDLPHPLDVPVTAQEVASRD